MSAMGRKQTLALSRVRPRVNELKSWISDFTADQHRSPIRRRQKLHRPLYFPLSSDKSPVFLPV